MAAEPIEGRLRRQAARGARTTLVPQDADHLADVVEAARRVEAYGWGESAPAGLETAIRDLRAALERL